MDRAHSKNGGYCHPVAVVAATSASTSPVRCPPKYGFSVARNSSLSSTRVLGTNAPASTRGSSPSPWVTYSRNA